MDTRPAANIIVVDKAQTKLIFYGNEEPAIRNGIAAEIHNSTSVIRNTRETELEPEMHD